MPSVFLNFLISSLLFFSCSSNEVVETAKLSFSEVPLVTEANSNLIVDLDFSLDKSLQQDVSFELSTEDYTATAGSDFVALSNLVVTIPKGETTVSVPITIIGDDVHEETEEFFINIHDPNPSSIEIAQKVISITILNDDEEVIVNPNPVIPETGYSTPESYSGMDLIWQDEFNSTEINEANWTFEIGTGSNGWGNNELEYYRRENAYIYENNLIIEAKKENFGGRSYTSSRMITKDKFEFKYGRVDIRAALPYGKGIWPALWMLGENISTVGWPACGEVDIMELIGGGDNDATVYGTLHWDNNGTYACTCDQNNSYSLSNGVFADQYHVFTLTWDENFIKWYVDDNLYKTVDVTPAELSEFHNNFFFIFNVAVGGNWPGSPDATTVFPQRMIVDYIRVFQKQ
ncbi:MAG: family 16 glycosylhydrolase [Cyclobacteriaceae bacterium]|nr:family 16 glycosylhydrolase [Cyclobacteriaceae bacterium]